MQDVSATVKHVRLVYIFIEKQWKSSTVEYKKMNNGDSHSFQSPIHYNGMEKRSQCIFQNFSF